MPRPRTLDREAILDATEQAVLKYGAAHLTLDIVARLAAVSKASVLYDHGSKQALIAAVITRALMRDNTFNQQMTAQVGAAEHPSILGRIAATQAAALSQTPTSGSMLHLIAALAQDAELRTLVRNNQFSILTRIADESQGQRGPLLAYLALEGLKFLEHLEFVRWDPAEREQLLEDIRWLVGQVPPVGGEA